MFKAMLVNQPSGSRFSHNERNDEKDQEDKEEYFSNRSCCFYDPKETKDTGNNGNN